MLDLLEKPEDFNDSIKRTSASIISIILYGFRATDSKSFWANVSRKFSLSRSATDLSSLYMKQ
jgi:hypothetical protein